MSHDTCRMRTRPHLGSGCHFHVVSGQPLIKVRATTDHHWCAFFQSTHLDWKPKEGGWVSESQGHRGTIFPRDSVGPFATQEAASGLACLSTFLRPSCQARLHKPGLPSSPQCTGSNTLTAWEIQDPEFRPNSPQYMPIPTRQTGTVQYAEG